MILTSCSRCGKTAMSTSSYSYFPCIALYNYCFYIQHEVRKREIEYERFKERMQRVLNDRYRSAKIGLKILNPAPKSAKSISNNDRNGQSFIETPAFEQQSAVSNRKSQRRYPALHKKSINCSKIHLCRTLKCLNK